MGIGEVAIPEKIAVRRVTKQRAIICRDELEVIRLIGSEDRIEILIDRRADDQTTVLGIVGFKIGTTTCQADAQSALTISILQRTGLKAPCFPNGG